MLQNQAVEGARAVARQVDFEVAIDFANVRRAVDQVTAVGILEKILVQCGRVGGELADDFLEDILDCHETLDIAVFVDDETDAALVLAEIDQLRGQRRALRNEVALARQFHQAFGIELVLHQQRQDSAQQRGADQVVDISGVNRDAGVGKIGDQLQGFVPVVLEVDADDFAARHHDVVDGDLFQVEYAEQHIAVRIRNEAAGLVDRNAQFGRVQRIVVAAVAGQQEQPEYQLGKPVDDGDQRIQQFRQWLVDVSRRKRDSLRIGCRQGFWRDLGEQQQYQREQSCRDGDSRLAIEAIADVGCELGNQHVDKIVTQQDQRDQLVRSL